MAYSFPVPKIVAGRVTPSRARNWTLENKLSKETHVLTKQDILLGKGTQVESRRTQENSSATWLTVSGFMMMGLVSRLSLSAKMDASKKDSGRWSDMWCLLLTFSELFRLVEAYQFPVPYQNLLPKNNSCK